MSEVRRYTLSVHDENWHQIWREDGEGRELPYCEIVNTDKETSEEITKALNDYDDLAARLAECEQVKAEAIAHAAGLSSDLTGMGERLAEAERERDAYKSRLETRWQQADGKIEVELTRWDNLTQQLTEAQATVEILEREMLVLKRQCGENAVSHMRACSRAEQAEQQVARLHGYLSEVVAFFMGNHEDAGLELYGRVNGEELTPSARALNALLAEIREVIRVAGGESPRTGRGGERDESTLHGHAAGSDAPVATEGGGQA